MGEPRPNVLITGGAGFLGSHIADALVAGSTVHVLDNLASGQLENLNPDVVFHHGDVRSKADVSDVLVAVAFDAVVHCAAQTSVPRSLVDPDGDWSINVGGTHNLVRLSKLFGVRRFVFISSGGAIYGRTDQAAAERDLPSPASFYGLHKFAAEQIIRAEGLSSAVLRPSNIYGARQRTDLEGGVIAIFLERLLSGAALDVFGDGSQRRDFVYVEDVVRAVAIAIESRFDVTWNVASGRSTSIRELLDLLVELTGQRSRMRQQPRRQGDVDSSLLSPKLLQTSTSWGQPSDLRDGLGRLLATIGHPVATTPPTGRGEEALA